MQGNRWIVLGAGLAGLGVAVGAFGAHGFDAYLLARESDAAVRADRLETFSTGVEYHLVHAIGIVLCGLVAARRPSRSADMAGLLFLLGIVLFSGLLYAWVLGGPGFLVHIVPFGGLAMIAGWFALAAAAWRREPAD